jgi:hypothetical protein
LNQYQPGSVHKCFAKIRKFRAGRCQVLRHEMADQAQGESYFRGLLADAKPLLSVPGG